MLMDKLNQMKSWEANNSNKHSELKIKHLSNINSKSYGLHSNNSLLKINSNRQNRYPILQNGSSGRLNLKGKSNLIKEKENLNEMIFKKYESILNNGR